MEYDEYLTIFKEKYVQFLTVWICSMIFFMTTDF
jgi:hypothetical protein